MGDMTTTRARGGYTRLRYLSGNPTQDGAASIWQLRTRAVPSSPMEGQSCPPPSERQMGKTAFCQNDDPVAGCFGRFSCGDYPAMSYHCQCQSAPAASPDISEMSGRVRSVRTAEIGSCCEKSGHFAVVRAARYIIEKWLISADFARTFSTCPAMAGVSGGRYIYTPLKGGLYISPKPGGAGGVREAGK